MTNYKFILSGLSLILMCSSAFSQNYPSLNNTKIDGYKSIWFTLGQFSEYGDKYSGGFATYTAKHIPLAIYAPEVQKTFFVYGGIADDRKSNAEKPNHKGKDFGYYLLCMAGCYDHKTGMLSKPTVVHDKEGVFDPHDNPAMAMDDDGYIWVFVSGRGRGRPGIIYKSSQPYNIDSFDKIIEDERTYPQPKYVKGKGFLHLFTKYTGTRLLYFSTSPDGRMWSEHQQLVAIKRPGDRNGGHYQISGQTGEKIVFFFNWHPNGGVDQRTNIYYLQTVDFGKTWTKVDGTPVDIPVTDLDSPTLIREFFSKKQNVYIKDVAFDGQGNPLALYVYGTGHQPGPKNGLKEWAVIYWNGTEWENHKVTTSDHNYDTGSLWVTGKKWTVIAPTENSPQQWGGGGELVMWESGDKGKTWKKAKQITKNSPRNHNYVRKVVNGVDPFMYFWTDGNPDKPSQAVMYFGDSKGNVRTFPYTMTADQQKPEKGQATASVQSESDKKLFDKKHIKDGMIKIVEWQLANPKHDFRNWTNGALYAGIFAAWETTKSKSIYKAMLDKGEAVNWTPQKRWYHADDIAISQTYIDLYRREKRREMIQPTIDTLNKFIANAYPVKGIEVIKWWWCDALFMAPPTLAKMGVTTGNMEYLKKNDEYFKECYDLLYNKEERLFARDTRYVIKNDGKDLREANGKRIFWSRGNGWVMGGLVRVLKELPKNYPERPFYENLFKEMAARIVSLQQPDGLWRASLLDPDSYPGGEVSGSGFFCYALAWGVNNGLLDKAVYRPAVEKAWIGLNACVNADGRVGWVQPIGGDPQRNVTADSWEVYGTGAFLLAASEVIKLK